MHWNKINRNKIIYIYYSYTYTIIGSNDILLIKHSPESLMLISIKKPGYFTSKLNAALFFMLIFKKFFMVAALSIKCSLGNRL